MPYLPSLYCTNPFLFLLPPHGQEKAACAMQVAAQYYPIPPSQSNIENPIETSHTSPPSPKKPTIVKSTCMRAVTSEPFGGMGVSGAGGWKWFGLVVLWPSRPWGKADGRRGCMLVSGLEGFHVGDGGAVLFPGILSPCYFFRDLVLLFFFFFFFLSFFCWFVLYFDHILRFLLLCYFRVDS